MEESNEFANPVALQGDQALVAALQARDERAFTTIVEAWTPVMTRVARTHVSTDASAADVVQETWLAVLRGLDRFEGRSSFKTWVFRILVNRSKTLGVREHRVVPLTSLRPDDGTGPTVDPDRFRGPGDPYPGGWRSFPEPWPNPEGAALDREVCGVVGSAIESLPVSQRLVITMRDVEGFTSHEVCELLALTQVNQRVLLHRARAAVRGQVELFFGARPGVAPS